MKIRARTSKIIISAALLILQLYLCSFFFLFDRTYITYREEADEVECDPVGISILKPALWKHKWNEVYYIAYIPLIKYYEWKKLAYTVMDADEFLGCKDEYCNEEASGDE